jgi:hypothetical protein
MVAGYWRPLFDIVNRNAIAAALFSATNWGRVGSGRAASLARSSPLDASAGHGLHRSFSRIRWTCPLSNCHARASGHPGSQAHRPLDPPFEPFTDQISKRLTLVKIPTGTNRWQKCVCLNVVFFTATMMRATVSAMGKSRWTWGGSLVSSSNRGTKERIQREGTKAQSHQAHH